MRNIFKLPVCPYCNAVTRYKDVKKTTHDKIIECHHCKKKYRVSYIKGRIILISIVCILLIAINIFLMKYTKGMTMALLITGNAAAVLISTLFFPYMVEYKKLDRDQIKKKNT